MAQEELLKQILDDSNQMIMVCEANSFEILYANAVAKAFSCHADEPYQGRCCYEYMDGKTNKCENCPLKNLGRQSSRTVEAEFRNHSYSVKYVPTEWEGKEAFIEYVSDVTASSRAQKKLEVAFEGQEAQLEEITALNNQLIRSHEAMEKNSRIIDALVRSYFNVYVIDSQAGVFETVKLQGYVTSGIDRDKKGPYRYADFCRKYADERVCEADRESFLACADLDNVIAKTQNSSDYEFKYRVMDNGELHYFSGRYTRIDDVYLVCGFNNIDALVAAEMKQKQELSEAYRILEAFCQEYQSNWLVDKDTLKMHLIRYGGRGLIKAALQIGKSSEDYETGLARYVEAYVDPEDSERMMREASSKRILSELKKNGIYAVNYLRRDNKGKTGYNQVMYANADSEDGKGQFVFGFRDVDALIRKEQTQQELAEAQGAAEAVYQTLGIGSWKVIYNSKGEFAHIRWSDHLRKMLGYSRKEFPDTQRSWINALHPDEKDRVLGDYHNAIADKTGFENYHAVYRLKTKSGEYRWFLGTGQMTRRADGSRHIFYGFFQDINDQMCANQRLEEAKKEAEAANSAKTSFLFNMSHDIRTPMNAIMGFRDILEKNQEDPVKRADCLAKIQSSSKILLSLIDNVLEMARIEKGTMAVEEKAYDLARFTDSIKVVFDDMMAKKGITFTLVTKYRHQYIYGDPTKLRQIFINIVGNAYKYTNPGGKVSIMVRECPADRDGCSVYESVITDTGIGMSEEFLPHIFEEFSRENNTTANKIEGTGLGMPIVKRLIDLMGGTITVKSVKGRGSAFTVRLPHRIASSEDVNNDANLRVGADDYKGRRILLAEDNDINAELAIETLTEAGLFIERAADGCIACDMLEKAAPGYYDLILMDIQMPNMNGYEATARIRKMADPVRAGIPILAMTANAFEEDRKAALDAGMNGHIAKPFRVEKLLASIAAAVAKDK